MSLFDMDTNIEKLPYKINEELINELSEDSSWNIIANYFVQTLGYKPSWARALEREAKLTNSKRSAELLIAELETVRCTVGDLCRILRECKILYALYLLQGQERLMISEQPQSNSNEKLDQVAIGETFTLRCNAVGVPPPRYQWFHGNVELPDQKTGDLNLRVTSPDQEGEYRCRVSQYNRDEELLDERFSEFVSLKVKPMPVVILKHPLSVEIRVGGSFVINCEAKGHPAPYYQWFKDKNKLKNERSNTLHIENVQEEHEGKYFCRVTNDASSTDSQTSEVTILRKALAKIALLIGNNEYENGEKLSKAWEDVIAIREQLKKIDYRVTCLENATRHQMMEAIDKFSSALVSGVYGFFYFAGHGFRMHESHMLPIDAPESPLRQDTISETELLKLALKSGPAFLVVILDMCLRVPDKESNEEIYKENPQFNTYKNNKNLIRAYSTCDFEASLEGQKAKNGIYASQLIKHIASKKPAIDVFNEVSQAVSRLNKGQTPQMYHAMEKPYRLTDAIDSSENVDPIVESVKKKITFKPLLFSLKFQINKKTYKPNLTIQPMNTPFANGLRIILSDMENLHVTFLRYDFPSRYDETWLYKLCQNQTDISFNGRECCIYNPEKHNPKAGLLILISIAEGYQPIFNSHVPYTNYIPEILKSVNQQ